MNNEKAFTLVEVIAVLSILSVILIATFSLMSQSKAEHDTQLKNNQALSLNSYILKQITSDIRESIDITSIHDEIIMSKLNSVQTIYKFDKASNILYRDGQTLANDLKSFDINLSNNAVTIQIANVRNEILNTRIYLRGE